MFVNPAHGHALGVHAGVSGQSDKEVIRGIMNYQIEVAKILMHERLIVGAIDAANIDGPNLPGLQCCGEDSGYNRRVTAAGQCQKDLTGTDALTDLSNLASSHVFGRKAVFGAANIKAKVLEHLTAVLAGGDFRMKLHAPEVSQVTGGHGGVVGAGEHFDLIPRLNAVAVALEDFG